MIGVDAVGGADAGGTSAPLPSIIPEAMASDLVEAWAELSNVHRSKTAQAGSYSYSYADLGDLLDVARPILAAHNLALIQPLMRMDSQVITVETMLIHSSGNYLSWFFDVQAGQTAQQTGSGITYARRYSALGALGWRPAGMMTTARRPPRLPIRRCSMRRRCRRRGIRRRRWSACSNSWRSCRARIGRW